MVNIMSFKVTHNNFKFKFLSFLLFAFQVGELQASEIFLTCEGKTEKLSIYKDLVQQDESRNNHTIQISMPYKNTIWTLNIDGFQFQGGCQADEKNIYCKNERRGIEYELFLNRNTGSIKYIWMTKKSGATFAEVFKGSCTKQKKLF